MTKALEPVFDYEDNEEGAAESAASLGPDGGPLVEVENKFVTEGDLFNEDSSWLDEELSDEELAALSDDGLDEFEFDDEDLDGVEFGLEDEDPTEFDRLELAAEHTSAEDFSLDDEFLEADEVSPDTGLSVPDDTDLGDEFSEAVVGGAIVKATERKVTDSTPPTYDDEEFEVSVGDFDDQEVDHRPVPRISIHAFCETPTVTSLLEQAAVDRRLSKTHLAMHMGGITKAIDLFQTTSTPNLIVIEAVESGLDLFSQLGALAEVCDPSTKVIIIGHVNDISLYRELVSKGISDYLVRPKSPLQIIASIAELYVDPSAPPIGKTIAFVGARGGVGSSTIAHNVAWSAAEEFESDTVILDLDLPFGTASLDFEQDPTSGLIEALTSPERLDDVLLDRLLQKHTDRLSLFTAPNLLDRDYDLDDQAFETVIDVVRAAAPTIVIDVPHIWTGWSRRILQTADEIVITAAPDLASFRNTKSLVDIISSARPNDAAPILVLNQFDPKVSSVPAEQFVEHVGLTPALTIGWEPQLFHAAATNAASILEVGAKTKTAQGLRDLASRVLGREETATKKQKFSLSGMFKK